LPKNSLNFLTSFVYVTLGGVVACSLYPEDPLNGDWWFLGWVITFPVNVISTTYRAIISQNNVPVLIIQLIMLLPTFILISKISSKRRNKKIKVEERDQ
jgi:hypothetical protein